MLYFDIALCRAWLVFSCVLKRNEIWKKRRNFREFWSLNIKTLVHCIVSVGRIGAGVQNTSWRSFMRVFCQRPDFCDRLGIYLFLRTIFCYVKNLSLTVKLLKTLREGFKKKRYVIWANNKYFFFSLSFCFLKVQLTKQARLVVDVWYTFSLAWPIIGLTRQIFYLTPESFFLFPDGIEGFHRTSWNAQVFSIQRLLLDLPTVNDWKFC